MAFQGDLSNINLASVFQNLMQNEQTGTLRLFDGDRDRYIYFKSGNLAMFSSGKESRTPVGEFLLRRGDVTSRQLVTAKKRRRGRRNLTTVLTRMGIEEKSIREAVRTYVEEQVCDLFTWDHGRFEFTEGEPIKGIFDSDVAAASLGIVADRVILEAARRADEWDRINRQIRSSGEIFVLRRERAPEVVDKFDPDTVEVSKLLDGKRDVEAVIDESGLGRFKASKGVAALLEAGFTRPVSLTEVQGQAENALQSEDWATAIRCFRRALEMERNNIQCRRGYAEALEGAGQKNEALAERKLLANTLIDAGRKEEAADQLRRAIEDVPGDITARERYVELLKASGADRQAESAMLDLGRTYMDLGIAEKARGTFAEVLEAKPREFAAVALMLAEACIKAGDVPGAVEAYFKAGEHYVGVDEFDKAADVFEEILKVQPGNSEAKRQRDEITSGRLLRRRRRWRLLKYAMAGVFLVILGISWLVYDFKVRGVLHEKSLEALVLVEKGDLEGAARCYPPVWGGWRRLTWAARDARSAHAHLSERIAIKLIAEADRLARRGRKSDAEDKYRRAAGISPNPETRERAHEALKSLGAAIAPGPG